MPMIQALSLAGDQRRQLLKTALATASLCAAGSGQAQTAKAGGVVFGFNRGSAAGAVMTALLPLLRPRYQPDLGAEVRYMPGNASRVAIDSVRRGPTDGSQALLCPSTVMTLLPHLNQTAGDSVLRDLMPVVPLFEVAFVFALGPAVPATVRTLPQYVAWAREQPSQAQFGVPGLGTGPHLQGMVMARALDVPLKPVAFQGLAPMLKDVLGGAVPAAFVTAGAEGFADGRLRPLLVTSDMRWPTLPQVPTAIELGLTDAPLVESFGLYFASGTPHAKVAELNAAVQPVLRAAPITTLVAELGGRLPKVDTPADFQFELLADSQRWQTVIKTTNFTLRG